MPHVEHPTSRRDFLLRAGGGFGSLALAALLKRDIAAAEVAAASTNPIAPKAPHFPATAKNVIWCFLDGGPSHIDLFDPKPELNKLDGQPLPASFKRPMTAMGKTAYTPLLGSKRKFQRHGQAGTWVSDWYPEIATCVDDIAVLRSCWADGLNHVGSICQMNTGSILGGRPCLGSWSLYGLGSECENLPGYVVLTDYPEEPPGGNRNWGTGFMPASFQGTKFREGASPVLHVAPAGVLTDSQQRAKLDFIQQLNQRHRALRSGDDQLDARIASYELAYRMQAAAPAAVDLAEETAETRSLYGLDDKATERNGRNCLLARRLVERGVRFVQLYMGSGSKWDAHANVEGNHARHCRESDKPIAGLVKDLKRRGMLDDTLVIWGGEFGRTIYCQGGLSKDNYGRDHHPRCFTMWMAGGGIKPGIVYGETDEFSYNIVDKPVHIHELNATILHTLGIDHRRLSVKFQGLDVRLTGVEEREPVFDLLA
jgi:hypothetical protein